MTEAEYYIKMGMKYRWNIYNLYKNYCSDFVPLHHFYILLCWIIIAPTWAELWAVPCQPSRDVPYELYKSINIYASE